MRGDTTRNDSTFDLTVRRSLYVLDSIVVGNPTSSGTVRVYGLTASQFVKTDSNKNLVSALLAVSDLPSLTSAQLAALLTDETGTGAAVFAIDPVLSTPTLLKDTWFSGQNAAQNYQVPLLNLASATNLLTLGNAGGMYQTGVAILDGNGGPGAYSYFGLVDGTTFGVGVRAAYSTSVTAWHMQVKSGRTSFGNVDPDAYYRMRIDGPDNGALLVTSAGSVGVRFTPGGGGSVRLDNSASSGWYFEHGQTTQFLLDASNNFGIGASLSPLSKLHVLGTIRSASVSADTTNKTGTFVAGHYTNAEEPLGLIGGTSTTATSTVFIGGGISTVNAATSVQVYTAANSTTTTGTLRAYWDGNGNLYHLGTYYGSANVYLFNASGLLNLLPNPGDNCLQSGDPTGVASQNFSICGPSYATLSQLSMYATTVVINGNLRITGLTASQFVKTDGSKNLTSALLAVSDLPSLTSAQLAALLTDETGTGLAVFGTSPTIATPSLVDSIGNTQLSIGTDYVSVANEIRLGGNSYSRISYEVGSGAPYLGYNCKLVSTFKHDSLGTLAGIRFATTGDIYFYTNVSAAANTTVAPQVTIGPTGVVTVASLTASRFVTTDASKNLTSALIAVADLPSMTSAQLAAILTDETGSGLSVFSTAPSVTGVWSFNAGLANQGSLTFFDNTYGIGIDNSDLTLWANNACGISFKQSTVGGSLNGRLTASGFGVGNVTSPLDRLHVLGTVRSASTVSDTTNKTGLFVAGHHTNAEEPLGLIGGTSTATTGTVFIGGGISTVNAATTISFYTAADSTTVTGTERGSISSSGVWNIPNLTASQWVKTDSSKNLVSSTLAVSDLPSLTSAQLAALLTDETGTGYAVFNNTPSIISPSVSGTLTSSGKILTSVTGGGDGGFAFTGLQHGFVASTTGAIGDNAYVAFGVMDVQNSAWGTRINKNSDIVINTTLNAVTALSITAQTGQIWQHMMASGGGTIRTEVWNGGNWATTWGTSVRHIMGGCLFEIAGEHRITHGSIFGAQTSTRVLQRTVGTTVGDTTEIGSWYFAYGAGFVEITITSAIGNYSNSAKYQIPVQYANQEQGYGNTWLTALPISFSGIYNNNDVALDTKINAETLYVRLRRVGGAENAVHTLTCTDHGENTSFSASTTTATGVAAPTVYSSGTYLTQRANRVGVGTPAPAYNFDVAGDIRATGSILAHGNYVTSAGNLYVKAGAGALFLDSTYANDIIFRPGDASTIAMRLSPTSGGRLAVGTITTPLDTLHAIGAIRSASTQSDNTNKTGLFVAGHRDNSEEALGLIGGFSGQTTSVVFIGGGTSLVNAATTIEFYTAADNTTVTGTLRGSISSAGVWNIPNLTASQWVKTDGSKNLVSSTLAVSDLPSMTSAQLAALLTDETGTGYAVFSESPAFTGVPTFTNLYVGTPAAHHVTHNYLGIRFQYASETISRFWLASNAYDFGMSIGNSPALMLTSADVTDRAVIANVGGDLTFYTGGTTDANAVERMRLAAGGDLQLGATGAAPWLKMIDTGTGNGRLQWNAIGAIDADTFMLRDKAGSITALKTNSSGYVGIAGVTPSYPLHVSGVGYWQDGSDYITINPGGSTITIFDAGVESLSFGVAGGVGTVNRNWQVNSTQIMINPTTPASQSAVLSLYRAGYIDWTISNSTANTLDFRSGGTLNMQIAGSNVGIGNATPAALFHVTAPGDANAFRVDGTTGYVSILQALGGSPLSIAGSIEVNSGGQFRLRSATAANSTKYSYIYGLNYASTVDVRALLVVGANGYNDMAIGSGDITGWLYLQTSFGNNMILNATGVGIGSNPSSLFHITTAGDANAFRVDNTTGGLWIGATYDSGYKVFIRKDVNSGASSIALQNASTGSSVTLGMFSFTDATTGGNPTFGLYAGSVAFNGGDTYLNAYYHDLKLLSVGGSSKGLHLSATGVGVGASPSSLFHVIHPSAANALRVDQTVGIGVAPSSELLSVAGNVVIGHRTTNDYSWYAWRLMGQAYVLANGHWDGIVFDNAQTSNILRVGWNRCTDVVIGTSSSVSTDNPIGRIFVTSTGNVGVGASPFSLFHVTHSNSANALRVDDTVGIRTAPDAATGLTVCGSASKNAIATYGCSNMWAYVNSAGAGYQSGFWDNGTRTTLYVRKGDGSEGFIADNGALFTYGTYQYVSNGAAANVAKHWEMFGQNYASNGWNNILDYYGGNGFYDIVLGSTSMGTGSIYLQHAWSSTAFTINPTGVGIGTGASYRFHVATSGSSNSLTIENTYGHTAFGTSPNANFQVSISNPSENDYVLALMNYNAAGAGAAAYFYTDVSGGPVGIIRGDTITTGSCFRILAHGDTAALVYMTTKVGAPHLWSTTLGTVMSLTGSTLNLAGLTASQFVKTDASKNLVSALLAVADLPSMTSAQLAALLTDETGTGAAVFGTSPVLSGPTITYIYPATPSGSERVRIMTTNTRAELDLCNSAGTPEFAIWHGGIWNIGSTVAEPVRIVVDTTQRLYFGTDGSNRIFNTSSYTNFASSSNTTLWLQNTTNLNNNWNEIEFNTSGGSITSGIGSQTVDHTNAYADLAFYTRGAVDWGERYRITSTGQHRWGYNVDLSGQWNFYASTVTGHGLVVQATIPANYALVAATAGAAITGSATGFRSSINSTGNAYWTNQQNGAGNANFTALVLGAGDAQTTYSINGGQAWSVGLDNSESDQFKISAYGNLGTNDAIVIDTSLHVGIGGAPDGSYHFKVHGSSSAKFMVYGGDSTGSYFSAYAGNGANLIAGTLSNRGAIGTFTPHAVDVYIDANVVATWDNTGNLQLGTTTTFGGAYNRLTVLGAVVSSAVATNASDKAGWYLGGHYTNAEEAVTAIYTYSASVGNTVCIGGGSGSYNAATLISFYTAANGTTTTGTRAGYVWSDGKLYWEHAIDVTTAGGTLLLDPGATNQYLQSWGGTGNNLWFTAQSGAYLTTLNAYANTFRAWGAFQADGPSLIDDTLTVKTAAANVPFFRSTSASHSNQWGFGTSDDSSFYWYYLPSGGAWTFKAGLATDGALTIAGSLYSQSGSVYSQGSSAAYFFYQRDNLSRGWGLYAYGDNANIWNGAANVFSVSVNADVTNVRDLTMSRNLTASGKFSGANVIESGYVEGNPVNFRFDQDCLRYVTRWGTATITATGGFTNGEVDAMFSGQASSIDLYGKSDPCSIEITGISFSNSAWTEFWPYVFLHANNNALTVKMEVKKGAGAWEVLYDGATQGTIIDYYVAKVTSTGAALTGVRWTFSAIANPTYLRRLGCIAKNGEAYQDTLLKSGGTVYGPVTIANGYTLNLANLTASRAVFTDASKNLVSVATTGSGGVVLATSAAMTTPTLTTPTLIGGYFTAQPMFTSGCTSSGTTAGAGLYQVAFSYGGGYDTYKHFLRTRHNSGATDDNAFDFYTCGGTSGGTIANAILGLTIEAGAIQLGTANAILANNATNSYERFSLGTNNLWPLFVLYSSANVAGFEIYNADVWKVGSVNAHDVAFITSNVERMRIGTNGRIGIGTSAPGWQLTLTDASVSEISLVNGSDVGAQLTMVHGAATCYLTTNGSSALVLRTNSTERMRISATGEVGIGVNPRSPLHVLGTDLRIADNDTDATVKYAYLVTTNYTNATAPVTLLNSAAGPTYNYLQLGPANGTHTGITVGFFYAAATATAISSTCVGRWTTTGIGVGDAMPASLFHVTASSSANALRIDGITGNLGIAQAPGSSLVGLTKNSSGYALSIIHANSVADSGFTLDGDQALILQMRSVTNANVVYLSAAAGTRSRFVQGLVVGANGTGTAGMLVDLDTTTYKQALGLPSVTTTERDALTGVNRMIVYNSTVGKFQGYGSGAWDSFVRETSPTITTPSLVDNSANVQLSIGTDYVNVATELRFNGNSFSRFSIDGGGAPWFGYNCKLVATFRHDSTGALAGIRFGSGGETYFYANTSAAANTTVAPRMTLTSAGALAIDGLTVSKLVATNSSKELVSVGVAGTDQTVISTADYAKRYAMLTGM